MSIIGISPEQLIDQQDYLAKYQGKIQAGHEMMCVHPYPIIEHQIQADTILSRQLHEEEHIQFRKQMNIQVRR